MTPVPPTIAGIPAEHQPATGSAPRWPLVLYFHHVHPGVRHYTALSPDEFERGLEQVLERFDPYDPADLLADGGPRRPERPTVLVTFDDGYRDNTTHARDILDRLGVRAVFFVCTGMLGRRSPRPREDYLTFEACDRLAGEGHLIGAHTRTHPHLDRIPAADGRAQTRGSLDDIRERYGPGPARLFAYPYGGVPAEPHLPDDVLAFGTVRSPATPWTANPQQIRRTYLPSGAADTWAELVLHWRTAWDGPTAPSAPGPS
ncbi:polysaccharide deacetylase family protein [Streptomyces sp. NBC_00704]|uniref:polysaccharide deacetylase family protein n=1 Tax=Streptomyces sp. NBC_00704 TaxID=2975809 RepID=UPI002E362ADA|nr:polysaccharide deacetylase family protein [Streptomyces sp. NBC_00704]